jgi:multidrug efflux pump subunit AcrB
MWIVRAPLNRPYTLIVLGLLILSPVAIQRTPTAMLGNVGIPVLAVSCIFTGMNPGTLEGPFVASYEKVLTRVAGEIQHLESTTVNGIVVAKLRSRPRHSRSPNWARRRAQQLNGRN